MLLRCLGYIDCLCVTQGLCLIQVTYIECLCVKQSLCLTHRLSIYRQSLYQTGALFDTMSDIIRLSVCYSGALFDTMSDLYRVSVC